MVTDLIAAGCQRENHKKGRRRWRVAVVWANRNKCVFENGNKILTDMLFEIPVKVFEWVAQRGTELKTECSEHGLEEDSG